MMHAPSPPSDAAVRHTLSPREMVPMMAMLMALNALAIDAMLPALPDIAATLGAPGNDRQYVIGLFLIGIGGGSLLYGPLADRFGRRRVILGALIGYVMLALGCAMATSFTALLVLRVVHGVISAALGVVVTAVIRDLFVGDAMARRMSLIFLVFMGVPVIAPALGQMILYVADWRWIFITLALLAVLMFAWVWRRLPETLDPDNVRPLSIPAMSAAWIAVILHRRAAGYMLAAAIVQGALYGYLNSSQQIVADVFGAGDWFAVIFAVIAIGIAISNFANSRIVERFGARRVSQTALFVYCAVSLLQLLAAWSGRETLLVFTLLLTVNVGLIGFIGSNFGSIAMEPFGSMAGVASSFQSFIRTLLAAAIGAFIGQAFDGTTVPMATGFLVASLIAILLILWAERGKLFTRPRTAPRGPF